jgi:hypothetical protein
MYVFVLPGGGKNFGSIKRTKKKGAGLRVC